MPQRSSHKTFLPPVARRRRKSSLSFTKSSSSKNYGHISPVHSSPRKQHSLGDAPMRKGILRAGCLCFLLGVTQLSSHSIEEDGKGKGAAPAAEVVLRIYDIRDLTAARIDFPGPPAHSEKSDPAQSVFQAPVPAQFCAA